MQKTVIGKEHTAESDSWLDLKHLAHIEITSEDAEFPIESALLADVGSGWRSSQPGEQTIRLLFNNPQRIQRIQLEIIDEWTERIQEFVIRWLPENGTEYRDVVRQQFIFSPGGATKEFEDYAVDLLEVTVLEVRIKPDLSNRPERRASLRRLRIA